MTPRHSTKLVTPKKFVKLTLRQKQDVFKLSDEKVPKAEIARRFGVSPSAIGKQLKIRSRVEEEIQSAGNYCMKNGGSAEGIGFLIATEVRLIGDKVARYEMPTGLPQ